MQETNLNQLLPRYDDGRFFISPILGCSGACSYCYLDIKKFKYPRKNNIDYDVCKSIALDCPDFIWGSNGTIISVGAWGDIFPKGNLELSTHSVHLIKELLKLGNPVQIMSKNSLCDTLIENIATTIEYPNQLLYSTTITSLEHWKNIEPCVSSPYERLEVCKKFHNLGIPTNVLIKPFLPGITDIEFSSIANLLCEYSIDYCTLGIMYLSPEISKKIKHNKFLQERLKIKSLDTNHLDCNSSLLIESTSISDLLPYIHILRNKGISAFLKSTCVNANILSNKNPSGYFDSKNDFCIYCGNCAKL